MNIKTMALLAALAVCAVSGARAQSTLPAPPVYKNSHAPLEARVSDLLGRLTQDEKLSLLTGTDFTTQPVPRLGIPPMSMVDAGQGVRGGMLSTLGPATLFPAGVAMAASWDTGLVGRIGQAIGEEALNKGTGSQILLGPAVNIQRSPLGGRNGEYFSEDPFLAGRLGVGYILGMQSTGCGACLKHFACNNEEADRDFVNVHVGERALREIYLPAFEMSVRDAHPWAVMSAYNKVRGRHATANEYLLTEVLKKGWGYDGLVMSDWLAVHETIGVVNAGNDLEMPGPGFLSHDNLALALRRGQITQTAINSSLRRILRTLIRTGLLDKPRVPDHAVVNSPAHQKLAFDAAAQSLVLLKNSGALLPLDATRIRSVAVIGPAAANMQYGAAGSPSVQPFYSVSPLAGITRRVGPGVTVRYAQGLDIGVPIPASAFGSANGAGPGLRADYFANPNLEGAPVAVRTDTQVQDDWNTAAPAPGVPRTNFSVRWTGTLTAPATGRYTLALSADDGSRLFLDSKALIDHWTDGVPATQTADVNLEAGHAYALRLEYFQGIGDAYARLNWTVPGASKFAEAVNAAAKSDVAVVCVGTLGTEGEGVDRPSMSLPNNQEALIRAVAAANRKTIVVLNNGTPCLLTGWLAQVPGLIEAWFPGQEGGHALADMLFGDVNPSGKLPTTFGAARADYPDFGHFPGVNGEVDYAEGIYVGYRHFDKKHIAPVFPFGYGLSYTTFQYGPLRLSQATLTPSGTVTARLAVTNTGRRAGAEVVELYVHDPRPKIDKPVRELKGFQKLFLLPGQTKTASFSIGPRALAYCDVPGKQWKADAGEYVLEAGASSRDIRQSAPVRLTATFAQPIPFLDPRNVSGHSANDLAFGRPVVASSVQPLENAPPQNIVDGDDSTRWSSQFADPQWIAVDLGKPVTISHVRLTWENAFASAYAIQTSLDGKSWTDAYANQDGMGGVEDIKFAPTLTRWVRMYGTKRASQYGYSLFTLEVYAPGME